jgi:glyoxylase-like metal-dependent hydrolase (beta-lactamase superfamily II)
MVASYPPSVTGLNVERFVCGRARSNAYVLSDQQGRALLVDAGMGASQQVIATVQAHGLRPQAVVLTHGHPDHIWTARHLSDRYDVPTYIHTDDLSWFSDPATGEHVAVVRFAGRALGRARRIRPRRLHAVADGQRIAAGAFDVDVLHTPGHSKGSVCLRVGGVCFAGDTVFRGNVGAVYLGGDRRALGESIRTKLLPLPDDVRLLPGHGAETTVGAERAGWERFLGDGPFDRKGRGS